jgi:hypothetical protein
LEYDTMASPGRTRFKHVPPEDAQLEAFKGELLLAVSQLSGEARSQLAREVDQLGQRFRGLQSADRQNLRQHLEQFAQRVLLVPAPAA